MKSAELAEKEAKKTWNNKVRAIVSVLNIFYQLISSFLSHKWKMRVRQS